MTFQALNASTNLPGIGSFFAGQNRTPAYQILLNGKDITDRFRDRLISLHLTDNRAFEADQVEIQLDDSDGLLDIPPRNARLQVLIGWAGQPLVDKGEFTVDEVEHSGAPDVLTVRGRSADLRQGLTTKRERSFHRKTIGEIVATIAGQNNLIPVVSEEFKNVLIDHLDQTSESDANLLTRLAEQFDAVATVKSKRLLFFKAGMGQTASGQPIEPVHIARAAGDRHTFSIAERQNYTAVKACWQDTAGAKKGEVVVDANTEFKRVHGKTKTGKTSKRTKVAAVNQPPIEPAADNVKVLRHVYATEANATRAARSAWERMQRGLAEFSLTLAMGRPDLMPEVPVTVSGFKPIIDRTLWLLASVEHTLDNGGYTNQLRLEMRLENLQEKED
ncbi:phage late control D family protein [Crenobacter sp. SG2303]|uniref:Phage late control D family protein n=1 Tax=Crenobacter oryzisoli TaxID=3056844 RepID=A0ABT7XPC1_9NEIS|nr:phage late control D family protein [Crenobacter sp. SG2303]MDN0075611.1 phage late control D family protein [Crenobacter sp. SG2303]